MEIGVFIPIGNNGWLISSTSPQYTPSFDLNREVVLRAERYGFDFALSMIKLRGFGGKSRYWDDNLESFTLMAGLAVDHQPHRALCHGRRAHHAAAADGAHGDDHRFDLARTLRRQPGHRLAEGRVRPDGHLAGRRALQAPLRGARRIRHGDDRAVDRRPVRPQGQVLHHERLPAGAAAVAADPHDLRRHQRCRHGLRRQALRLQLLQRQRPDERSARLRRFGGAAEGLHDGRRDQAPRRWHSP